MKEECTCEQKAGTKKKRIAIVSGDKFVKPKIKEERKTRFWKIREDSQEQKKSR